MIRFTLHYKKNPTVDIEGTLLKITKIVCHNQLPVSHFRMERDKDDHLYYSYSILYWNV